MLLINRVRAALPEIEITELEGWELTYDVEPFAFPPIELEQPRESRSLGKFPTSFYTEPPTSPDKDPELFFGDDLALLAYRVTGQNEVEQCEHLFVRTWWQTENQPSDDYHITLVLADQTGIGRAQSDSPLAYSLTSQWRPSQDWIDRREIPVPCDLLVGTYNLLVGLYDLETVQNLEITYSDGTPYGQLAFLTTIEVKEKEDE
jgi:hypothetical protein